MIEEQDWSSWYQEERIKYEKFTEKLADLIRNLIPASSIEYTLEHRTKTIDSYKEKINRNGKTYNKPSDITDLSALRIIVRTTDDLKKVAKVLQTEFLIDKSLSINKSDVLEINEFGYLSEHYVLTLSENRTNLTEWIHFSGLYAEVQVRTILQHAWVHNSAPSGHPIRKHSDSRFVFIRTPFRSLSGHFRPALRNIRME